MGGFLGHPCPYLVLLTAARIGKGHITDEHVNTDYCEEDERVEAEFGEQVRAFVVEVVGLPVCELIFEDLTRGFKLVQFSQQVLLRVRFRHAQIPVGDDIAFVIGQDHRDGGVVLDDLGKKAQV